MKKLIIARRVSQIFFLALFVYILWSTTYPMEGILPPETFFKTNPLIMIFTSISERVFLPLTFLAIGMIGLTILLGRFYCGWICPLGTMIDGVGALKKKKRVLTDKTNKKLHKVKHYILLVIGVFALFGIQFAWVLDPMVIMARFVSLNLIPTTTLIVDKFFIFLIQKFNLYGPLYEFYRTLKGGFLGVKVHYFSNSVIIFSGFLFICISALFVSRFWCRTVCPLGGLYSLTAKFAFLRRIVEKCIGCGKCKPLCRMGAIKDDITYDKGECILCMDCVYGCPVNTTKFSFPKKEESAEQASGISRKDFLFLIFSSIFLAAFKWRKKIQGKPVSKNVIRPPGALKEKEFVERCIRCGNCMKVCPTNVLQPTMLEAGIGGIWTPHLVNEIGYCEYNCTLCGEVCPTGAITKLTKEKKHNTKIGTAKVDRSICLAWEDRKECLVCEEHCPVPTKAIKISNKENVNGKTIGKPVVLPEACIGCGICQNKCPVSPTRAIKVTGK